MSARAIRRARKGEREAEEKRNEGSRKARGLNANAVEAIGILKARRVPPLSRRIVWVFRPDGIGAWLAQWERENKAALKKVVKEMSHSKAKEEGK